MPPEWQNVVLAAAMAAIASAAATWAWIRFVRLSGLAEDHPGFRRLHAARTPRGAGVGLMIGWLLGVLASGMRPEEPMLVDWLAFGTGGLMLCGLFDDFLPLPAWLKLLAQVAVAVFVLWPGAEGMLVLAPWQALLAGLAMLVIVNGWNFMDGSNGMIAWQSLLLSLALGLWPGQDFSLRIVCLTFAAACAGFLPFNFPSARAFLGDAGSLGTGAAIFLMLLLSWNSGVMALWQAVLLCTPMLLDVALTLARRVLRGRPFWRAHREHLYQYAVRRGHSHARVALAYAGATMLAWLLALAGRNQSMAVAVSMLGLAWLAGAVAYVALRHRWLARTIRTRSIRTRSQG